MTTEELADLLFGRSRRAHQSTDPFMVRVMADVERINARTRREPWTLWNSAILLTRAQADVVCDRNPPSVDDLPAWLASVESVYGMPIRHVDNVEASTPYTRGWIADTARHLAHPELPDHTPKEPSA